MVSKASDDFPDPDSPVKTTSLSRGISRSTFLRLCSRAPRIVIARVPDPAVCWRLALITSSISAFPGTLIAPRSGAHRGEGPGSDANKRVQNIGRTRANFQCSRQAINGLLRVGTVCAKKTPALAAAGSSSIVAQAKRPTQSAGLFEFD